MGIPLIHDQSRQHRLMVMESVILSEQQGIPTLFFPVAILEKVANPIKNQSVHNIREQKRVGLKSSPNSRCLALDASHRKPVKTLW